MQKPNPSVNRMAKPLRGLASLQPSASGAAYFKYEMTDKDSAQPNVTESTPTLAGRICQAVIVEAYLHKGEVISPANTKY